MNTFRHKEYSDATYEEMQLSLPTHPKLKDIYACAQQGSTFFIYKGCTRRVLSVLPGGSPHIVQLGNNNPLLRLYTEPGTVYIFGYTV